MRGLLARSRKAPGSVVLDATAIVVRREVHYLRTKVLVRKRASHFVTKQLY